MLVLLITGIVCLVLSTNSADSQPHAEQQNTSEEVLPTENVASSEDSGSAKEDSQAEDPQTKDWVPDKEGLVSWIGEESAKKLLSQAETDTNALWIVSHLSKYEFEGPEVEYKILKLAADEPESILYVREFPELFPAKTQTDDASLAMSTDSPSSKVPNTAVPHLYQWDRRWGQTVYCSTTFGLTGCGPTALAMVYQGLTEKSDQDPYTLSLMAQEYGYMEQFNGTDAGFFTQVASDLGLNCETMSPSAQNIKNALSQGKVIITNLAPGYFTRYGHFFVIAGVASNGKLIINDPYSVTRSGKLWDADFVAKESRILYVYS